jgi:RHS repeat-associated protein
VSAYTWDANGSNLTRNGVPGSFTFGYDLDNRLSSITGAATASYTYDYQGRRTSKTVGGITTTYLYDGLNLLRETVGGTPADYAFGPGIDEPMAQYRSGALSYFDADGLGTIGVTNDSAGTPSLSTSFDAWGVTKAETGTRVHPFTYTGREVGEAGLHFYRARFLQAGTGRFTQEDPIDGYTVASYTYAAAAPTSHADPTGMFELTMGQPVRTFFRVGQEQDYCNQSGVLGCTAFKDRKLTYECEYDCQTQNYFLRYHAYLSPFQFVPVGCGVGRKAEGSVCLHEDHHVKDMRERIERHFAPLESVPHSTKTDCQAFGRVQVLTFSNLINTFIRESNELLQ